MIGVFNDAFLNLEVSRSTCLFLSALHQTSRFASIVKNEAFYENHAECNPRRYFYNIDLQGRLFLGAYIFGGDGIE